MCCIWLTVDDIQYFLAMDYSLLPLRQSHLKMVPYTLRPEWHFCHRPSLCCPARERERERERTYTIRLTVQDNTKNTRQFTIHCYRLCGLFPVHWNILDKALYIRLKELDRPLVVGSSMSHEPPSPPVYNLGVGLM